MNKLLPYILHLIIIYHGGRVLNHKILHSKTPLKSHYNEDWNQKVKYMELEF